MGRELNKLTAAQVRAARHAGKDVKLFDGGGLFLHVTASGKYWRLKYRFQGKERLLALGPFPEVSLKEARDGRDAAKALLRKEKDPSKHKQERRQRAHADQASKTITFEKAAWKHLEQQQQVKPKTLELATRRLQLHVFPFIGHVPLEDVTRNQVLEVLRLLEREGKHETAKRMRQRISQIFTEAQALHDISVNPAVGLDKLMTKVKTKHHAAVTDPRDVGALMRAIRQYQGTLPSTRVGLELVALTAVRPTMIRLARWDQIDLDDRLWRVPRENMKMGDPHLVPLSDRAIELIEYMRPFRTSSEFLLPGLRPQNPISPNTFNKALRSLGFDGDTMVSHGFRVIASTLLHERGFDTKIIDLQLSHRLKDDTHYIYNRSARLKERRKLMQSYADYLDELRRTAFR